MQTEDGETNVFFRKKKKGKCKNVAVRDDIPCDVLIG